MNDLRWLFLFSTILFLSSCNNGVKKNYWESGELKSELRYDGDKLNGLCIWYDSNGRKQTQASYVCDTLEGRYLRWYPNGQLAEERWYHKGMQDSVCLTYSEKGSLSSKDYYSWGKLNGESKKWYDNGQVFQEGQYKDGMMDSSWFIFYPSGALASKADYKMGTGKQICYEESGYKCLEVPYVNNLKHGKEIYFNPDGGITKIVEYKDGKVVFEDNDPQNAD